MNPVRRGWGDGRAFGRRAVDNVILTLLAAAGFLAVLFGGGLLWMRILFPHLDAVDQVAAAPALAVVYFGAVTATALIVPWSFSLQAALGMALWVAGALGLGWTRARRGLARASVKTLFLIVPVVCGSLAVAAFGAVQGDPGHTVSYPGTLLSARVTNLPPDDLFPVLAAQVLQHHGDFTRGRYFGGWDLTDRTPLAGAVAASVLSGTGTTLPAKPILDLPARGLAPQVNDQFDLWVAHLVLVLLNAFVIVAIGRLGLSIFGRRAALMAGLFASMDPFVFTHIFFTWPKMLAAYFVLLHYVLVRERSLPFVAGVFAGLAYLAHPLAGLFVLPSLVVLVVRQVRGRALALGGLVVTILPWQAWTAVWAHPSRMLTYPFGYVMRNPNAVGHEVGRAWHQFRTQGIGHAIDVRYKTLVDTFSPFNTARNFLTLPHGCSCISTAEAWFTIHDRTVPGIVLFVMIPFAISGLVCWWRIARAEIAWMLVAPFAVAVLFWGIDPQGLGAALLQPTAAVLVAVTAAGLAATRRPLAFAGAVFAIIESATVIWGSLFAPLNAANPSTIALAVLIWALPCGLLIAVITTSKEIFTSGAKPSDTARAAY
jgi:hypothetical protein